MHRLRILPRSAGIIGCTTTIALILISYLSRTGNASSNTEQQQSEQQLLRGWNNDNNNADSMKVNVKRSLDDVMVLFPSGPSQESSSSSSTTTTTTSTTGTTTTTTTNSTITPAMNINEDSVSLSDEQSGAEVNPAIFVGGDVDSPHKYPFFVWLNGCGGSLVAPNVVLSSARCKRLYPTTPTFVTLGMHKIILGGDDNFDDVEHIPIKRSVIHEDYYHDSKTYDFWVIQLEWASQLYGTKYIQLDEFGDDDEYAPKAGHDLVTIGFGRKKDENVDDDDDDSVPYIYPNVLQETTVKYITNNDCTNGVDYYYDHSEIYKSMLCAGGEDGEDTCEGDYGGPLVHVDAGNPLDITKMKLVGVASWGNECGNANYPGVYARVSEGFEFINRKITEWYSTEGPPVTGCEDLGGFYDSQGVANNCLWYAEEGNCGFSHSYQNAGLVASVACCACNGGNPLPTQSPTRAPTKSPTRSPTKQPTRKPSG